MPDTSLVRRARKIDRVLAETYPDARCELDFDNPFELLIVTVLSAQTTDRRVNAVRPALFAAYPDAHAMAGAERENLEQIIQPTGFFRAKTESLLKLSAYLVEHHGGEVPAKLDQLVKLPGVGRKTANVVLGLDRVGLLGEPETAGEPPEVRVDGDPRDAERVDQHHVGGLAPHPGELDQVLQPRRHLAVVPLDEGL